ncbi:DUF2490 domain-containing protein [Flavobacterium pectinovorum]|uniref:DUF2490 domain-containing protein n=1 Tax=Flavobacterium pectinovorum TaxID=29533 RepID=A0A502EBV1_9FLAO|nr:DUF2490 domain-containing protein [Flavobacterium pectinovorum]TPG34814.1 DUF2490 domain-containing protein [Flavobacterium pectinovorum]
MKRIRIHVFLLLAGTLKLYAQTDELNQFWNEYAFTKDLSQKWALELNIGLTTSSVSHDNNIFYNLTQVYGRGWAHYRPDDRWKISFFYAYFFNKNVPELNQKEAPEIRMAVQGMYRLLKEGKCKVNLRARFEDRHLQNEDGYFEAVMRFRFQVRAVYSFTKNDVDKNAFYAFVSDELFFKTKSQVSGPDLFDRNRATIGLGYFLTDDIQIEVSYANEIMPREPINQLVNAFQINIVFNDFLPNLIKSITPKKPIIE